MQPSIGALAPQHFGVGFKRACPVIQLGQKHSIAALLSAGNYTHTDYKYASPAGGGGQHVRSYISFFSLHKYIEGVQPLYFLKLRIKESTLLNPHSRAVYVTLLPFKSKAPLLFIRKKFT